MTVHTHPHHHGLIPGPGVCPACDAEQRRRLEGHPIVSDQHALVAGQVWGIAMAHGLDLLPVVDEAGNYTAAAVLRSDRLPEGVTITLVVLPPEPEREGL